MSYVTYLLGAKARADTLPITNSFSEELDNTFNRN